MQGTSRQRGLTLWGVALIIFIAVFFLFLAFKLVPPYITDAEIGSALRRVATQPGAGDLSVDQIRASISKQFDVDYIRSMDPYKDVQVQATSAGKTLVADYSVEIPLVGNISAVLYFNHEVQVR
jgi:hypothetical protein